MKHYQEKSFLTQYPLSPKKPVKKTILSFFIHTFWLIVFVYIVLIVIFKDYNTSSWLTAWFWPIIFLSLFGVVILIGATYAYQYWYYKTYFYNLTDEYVIIRKGLIAPQEVTIPYEKIQDIYVDQDILDRMFGLYDVHISSPTATSGLAAHIDGVNKEIAEKLREIILTRVRSNA